MEVLTNPEVDNLQSLPSPKNFLQISCNWQITNNKQFFEGFTTGPTSKNPENINIDDVFSLDTCLSLQPTECDNEPCMLEIRVTNRQRISRIAVVSEAYTLEFFKQFGEYDKTIFAEFVEECEGNSVYFAETTIAPPSTEASIKFTQTKCNNSVMWIYGIKLFLTEPVDEPKDITEDIFNPEIIKNLLTKFSFNRGETDAINNTQACYKNALNSSKRESIKTNNEKDTASSNNESNVCRTVDITTYIDNKFHDMETRLMKRIDEMEQKTNQKLDTILKALAPNIV